MNIQKNAKFITFEGTEGVGKTTAIDGFCGYLAAKKNKFVRTREIGGTVFAEQLREFLLNPQSQINQHAELLAIFAARTDHLHKLILPALARGEWVVCDRFIDSTVAYQGFGRFRGAQEYLDDVEFLIKRFVPILPDITFWLDLDVLKGLERADKRGNKDRFEQETVDFFERVYQGFLYQAANHNRIIRIDADGDRQALLERIIASIDW